MRRQQQGSGRRLKGKRVRNAHVDTHTIGDLLQLSSDLLCVCKTIEVVN
jgi:hypothetical protein